MLKNLTCIPEILNQYKNITQKENIHNASYILAVGAIPSTPFCNIKKDFKIIGLISDDISDEKTFIEFSIQKLEDYIKKISEKNHKFSIS